MKFRTIALAVLASGIAATQTVAQDRADQQHLSDPASSTLILLGDPQGYIKYDLNQPIFELCTAWIADNADNLHIAAVLCTGDIVEQNDNNALNRRMLNQSSRQMWEAASKAFSRIDGKVPYIISGGNHDYGFKSSEDYHTFLPDYFTFERQGGAIRDRLVSEYPNREGRASLENSAYEFSLPGWTRKILVITSEFTPCDGVLDWAQGLCRSDRFKDHVVIFMTHSYMLNTGKGRNERIGTERYGISRMPGNNSGVQVWEKLVSQVPNIRFVLCGHDATGRDPDGSDNYLNNVGWRIDRNIAGKNVHQMMFNVQTLGGGWEGNGGDGWLRILEFLPDGSTVKVSTYSPLFGISPLTRHLAHRTEPHDQFEFRIEE